MQLGLLEHGLAPGIHEITVKYTLIFEPASSSTESNVAAAAAALAQDTSIFLGNITAEATANFFYYEAASEKRSRSDVLRLGGKWWAERHVSMQQPQQPISGTVVAKEEGGMGSDSQSAPSAAEVEITVGSDDSTVRSEDITVRSDSAKGAKALLEEVGVALSEAALDNHHQQAGAAVHKMRDLYIVSPRPEAVVGESFSLVVSLSERWD